VPGRATYKFLGTVVPHIPTWAVYGQEDGTTITEPVLIYTVYEGSLSDGSPFTEFRAVPFNWEYLDEDDSVNLLGLSLTETPDPKAWPTGKETRMIPACSS
jgi:hypothetical protein